MDFVDLEIGLHKFLASQGQTLDVHEIIGLNAGAGKLQYQEKFKLYFWGKINAAKGSYYIVYGFLDNAEEFASKKFYYSTRTFEFAELSSTTDEAELAIIQGERFTPFSGDPDSIIGPAAEDAEEEVVVAEVSRLAWVVAEIDFETAVVPKGSYTLNENQKVVLSPGFGGLKQDVALKLENYVHLRPPISVEKLRVIAEDDIEWKSVGFLDSLDQDLPRGSWAIRDEGHGANVHLRSLTWPGYAAFHVPRTRHFGGVYFGFGIKNNDLPFLL